MAWSSGCWICCWPRWWGRVGGGGWAPAHRFHSCDLGGAGSEPVGAGRESVRACVQAVAVVAPGWLPAVIDVADWSRRYGARIDTWRLPTTPAKRTELVAACGADARLLLRAVSDPQARRGCGNYPPSRCCAWCCCRTTWSPPTPRGGRCSGRGRPTRTVSRPAERV